MTGNFRQGGDPKTKAPKILTRNTLDPKASTKEHVCEAQKGNVPTKTKKAAEFNTLQI